MRTFLKSGGAMLIPFFSFGLGTGIDFTTLVEAGASGIILGLMTAFLGALINVTVSRFVGGTGIAGAAVSTTAGNAVATPAAIAAVDPTVGALISVATPQIAASTIVTSLVVPFITAWVAKREQKRLVKKAQAAGKS